jgi:hypothetical protein
MYFIQSLGPGDLITDHWQGICRAGDGATNT